MKNRKGMTLVEVIVAIGLLGLIAVGLLTALTGYVGYISRTKIITQDIFHAQEKLELEIQDLKTKIRNGTETGYTAVTYDVFGQTFSGYQLSESAQQHVLTAVVGSGVEIVFPVPVVETISAGLSRTTTLSTNFAYGNEVGGTALRAVGDFDIASGEPSFVNKLQWYVSRTGFNTPMIPLPQEIEIGSKYPRFPEDYEPIPSASNLTLTELDRFIEIGRASWRERV